MEGKTRLWLCIIVIIVGQACRAVVRENTCTIFSLACLSSILCVTQSCQFNSLTFMLPLHSMYAILCLFFLVHLGPY